MKNVCDINCLKSVIKVLTCFRNSDNTTLNTLCIYLIQSIPTQQCFWNRHFRLPSFDNNWIQNGISKKIIAYRDCKNFDNTKFRYDTVTATSNVDNFGMYKSTIFNIFNPHVPIKKNTFEIPFMSKEFHTAIMKNSD